jgi:phage anti-repressor protein
MSNSNLIPVFESTINDETVQTVNAREVYASLEVKKDFSNWIKAQIERARLVENRDYVRLAQKGEVINQQVTTTIGSRIDYHLTLRAATHVALMSNTDKGCDIRDYFIDVEDAYRKQQPKDLTKEQILVMALESERARMVLEKKLEEAQPMIDFHEEVSIGEGEFTIPNLCKTLFNGAVTDRQLREWMKNQRWMDRRKGFNEPTMWAIHQGLMRLKLNVKIRPGHVVNVPVITAKGLALLRHLYRTGELFVATIPMERRLTAPQMAM